MTKTLPGTRKLPYEFPEEPTNLLLMYATAQTGRKWEINLQISNDWENAMRTQIVSATQARYLAVRKGRRVPAGLGFAAFLVASAPALAATAPNLGTTSTYGIVSSTLTNNLNPTNITGDVCYTTAPVLPPTSITGATVVPCPAATGTAQTAALATLNGQACLVLGAGAVALDTVVVGANPPGTLPPGCYSSGGAMNITAGTTVTLSGSGVYIFRPGGPINAAANSHVAVAGGACEADVFWGPVGATTLGANVTFVGNILDGVANAVTMGSLTALVGRVLSFGGSVTLDSNTITTPACAPFVAPVSTTAAIPTLSEWAMVLLAALLAVTGFVTMRRKAK